MDALAPYRRLFAYDDWANREALASLEQPGPLPAAALMRLAHIVAAQALWLERLRPGASGRAPMAVWPALSLAACRDHLSTLPRAWAALLEDASLDRTVAYTNSKGEAFESRVGDILQHVVLHGAYHRGQIAADVRAAGNEPAYTDFIHSVRQGFVD